MKKHILTLASIAVVLACGQSRLDRRLSSPSSSPLPSSSLSPSSPSPSPSALLASPQHLNPTDAAFEQTAAATEAVSAAATDACSEQALQQLVMHAKGNTLTILGTLDLATCSGLDSLQTATDGQTPATSDEQRVSIAMTCEGVDLTPWDGKTYGELVLANEHPCAKATGAHVYTRMNDQAKALSTTLRSNL